MHMVDALLSAPVGGVMALASGAAVAYSVRQLKKTSSNERIIPMMGIMGAFIFAAQMINFAIPGTGSSGHIVGGILLTAIVGPYPALIAMASVLFIQCLFFADGGLLALGANIFNMGVASCLVAYPLLFRPVTGKKLTTTRITTASVLSVILGLQLGSFGVVLQTVLSGIAELPFIPFLSVMQPIHLAIGLAEGFVTAGILCFVHKIRPEIINGSSHEHSMKKLAAPVLITAVLMAGGLSLAASEKPDGLEWSIEKVAGASELKSDDKIHEVGNKIQRYLAFMPGYAFKPEKTSKSLSAASAGIIGGTLTLALAALVGLVISKLSRRKLS